MKNILAAIDFSDLTGKVVEKAGEFAEKYRSKVWLVHIAASDPGFMGHGVSPSNLRDERARILRREHQTLQDYAKDLSRLGVEAESLLIQGPVVRTLREKAYSLHADLIVLGAHIHGSLYDKLIGNTWQELIEQSTTPIMVVPSNCKTTE